MYIFKQSAMVQRLSGSWVLMLLFQISSTWVGTWLELNTIGISG